MDRGAWRAPVLGVTRVGHDLVSKPVTTTTINGIGRAGNLEVPPGSLLSAPSHAAPERQAAFSPHLLSILLPSLSVPLYILFSLPDEPSTEKNTQPKS